MTRGGKREGAGRPLTGSTPAKSRTIRVNDEDWKQITLLAQKANVSVTRYIINSAISQKTQYLSNSEDQ